MRAVSILVLLLAGVALADRPTAPYGHYSLDARGPLAVTIDGRRMPPCGVRAKSVLDTLRSFEVDYSRDGSTDAVVVDGRPWSFAGYNTVGGAIGRMTIDGFEVSLSFGIEGQSGAIGQYTIILPDGSRYVCAEGRRVVGRYTPPP